MATPDPVSSTLATAEASGASSVPATSTLRPSPSSPTRSRMPSEPARITRPAAAERIRRRWAPRPARGGDGRAARSAVSGDSAWMAARRSPAPRGDGSTHTASSASRSRKRTLVSLGEASPAPGPGGRRPLSRNSAKSSSFTPIAPAGRGSWSLPGTTANTIWFANARPGSLRRPDHVRQQCRQPPVGPVRARLHGSQRHTQLIGDLGVGHADEMGQSNDLTLLGRKLPEGGSDLPSLPGPLERQRDHRHLVVAELGGHSGALLAPVDIDGDAAGDGIQPRRQLP